MATLLRVTGETEELTPPNGVNWELADLQTLVGGYIEIVSARDGKFIVIDEEGKLKRKPVNEEATRLYRFGDHDPIVGDVIIINTHREMNGDEEDDDA